MIFWVGGKNCIVKNEKYIVFPESRYVNSNPGIPQFWACRDYTGFWTCQNNFWTYLSVSKCAWMCLNLPEWQWLLFEFCIVIPCLLERVVTCFIIYTKLEVIVWMNTRLFSWRDKIWFFPLCLEVSDLFFDFRLHYLGTKFISKNVALPLQKALWTSLKLSRKVESQKANVKTFLTWGWLFISPRSHFFAAQLFYVNSRLVKIYNFALFWTVLPVFRYIAHMLWLPTTSFSKSKVGPCLGNVMWKCCFF